MISGLVAACRAAGLRISTAETLDAIRAAAEIGWTQRAALKRALSLTLAKSFEDKKLFSRCFDRFFELMPPEHKHESQQIEMTAELMQRAREIDLDRIELFTQRGLYIRRLLEGTEGAGASGEAQEARTGQARLHQARLRQARYLVDRQLEIAQGQNMLRARGEHLMDVSLTEADQRDLEIMAQQVRRLAKKLALATSRRARQDIRGVPDIARSLRANLAHDGVMMRLVWKQRRVNRPRIFAICDVSGSVSAAVRFLLMFLYHLTEVVRGVRAFDFSNRLGEVSALFNESEFAAAYARTLKLYGGGSTDYGQSMRDFDQLAAAAIDRKTILIILGDARSNYGDCGAEVLQRLARHAGRVLWLNPEAESLWGSGDSEMKTLAPLCHEAHSCRTLRQLTHIIDDVMKVRV